MLQLDVMISVDAMPVHLAASLGRPTWVLLKHDCDWRWMRGRGDSPWYPTARLFRQPAEGDWKGAVSAAATALSAMR
jgi:ADP-heptose:LPS heptosyltransferase